jgi:xylulokinase
MAYLERLHTESRKGQNRDMDEYSLGIDIGSSSVKLTLLQRNGRIAASAGAEYPTVYPCVGWSEQDPEDWCEALKAALYHLLQKARISAEEIRAVSLDAATHTAVLLDDDRKPLSNAILWTDQRSVEEVGWLKENYLDAILRETLNTPTTVWTLPQLLWIRKHCPDIWTKIRHIVFAKDYLRFRLTGVICTDTIDAMGSMFYDVVNERWSETLCNVGGIEKSWLPELRSPTDTAGELTAEAAEEFGLAEGTTVFTGTTDTVMEVFAAGNVEIGQSTVKLATAGRICVVTNSGHASPFLFNYRHVVSGLWYPGTATSSCAASFRWFRNNLGQRPYEELDKEAAAVPPGSEGLMFHPYLQGELTPYNDPLLLGSYTGISSHHTTAHFTRATLEGIAFSLRDCMDTIETEGMHITRVRIIGGGAKSGLWRKIVSDVLGMHLEKLRVDDSSFGTAMLAAVGVGWFPDFRAAAEACIEIESVTASDPDHHELYERLFSRYRRIHDALSPIYHGE